MNLHCYCHRLLRPELLVLLALGTLVGCGRSTRTSVTGKVTFDGQPLETGQIVFEPKTAGRLGIAQVSQGDYAMPAEHGPTTGSYVVRITANRATGRKVKAGREPNAAATDQFVQFIPARYNDQSELTTDIGDEAKVVRDFELTSK
jgi:hypothetical protein